MAAVQSRLPAPSLKRVEKETTNSTITSKLRKPTPISISSTAPSSKQLQPTKQLQSAKIPQPAKQLQPTNQQKEKFPSETTSNPPQTVVPNKKRDFTHVKSRIGSLDNAKHKPKGGNVKIYTEKTNFSNVKSRIGSLENVNHAPKGGDIKIVSVKPDFSNVKSRVGSLDNTKHTPKGGNFKIFSSKVDLKHVHSRVGSLDNIDHVPKGGDRIIFDDKLDFSNVKPRVGSLDNIDHVPKGGDIKIFDEKLNFKESAASKIISQSSTTSSNVSSVIAEDERSSLVNSPISSLALDDSPEVVPSQEEYANSSLSPHTPTIEVLSPIMEHFEEEEEIHEGEEEFSLPVRTAETELSFEAHDSFQEQQRDANEKTNKHTEFSSKKETNFVYKDQEYSGKETHYQQRDIVYEDDDDSTSIRESTLFVTNNSLNDTDLSFEVNVLRKSTLLSSDDRNSIEVINPTLSKELVPTVEVPPKIEHEFHKTELTGAQQRVYDESWI